MNGGGILKSLDVLGAYLTQLEQDVARLQQENAMLREQLKAATKAEA